MCFDMVTSDCDLIALMGEVSRLTMAPAGLLVNNLYPVVEKSTGEICREGIIQGGDVTREYINRGGGEALVCLWG